MCSHVAVLLFKIEAACRLGYNKLPCTSQPCVWTAKGLFIERIYRDKPFWKKVSLKLSEFYVKHFLPKAIEESSLFVGAENFCFCHDIEYGEMVFCDNPTCPIGWFHFSCVGLQFPPTGTWHCSKCDGAL